MSPELTELASQPIVKILLAVLLSGVIGYEREISDKPAGLRTNILIGVGAALMMMISIHVAASYGRGVADPSRIAAQVVAGIGFLGAGTILRARGSVMGLTTAATIWAVAGIGLAVGSGQYALALLGTAVILGVLWILGHVEQRMLRKHATDCLRLSVGNPAQLLKALHDIYADTRVRVEEMDVTETGGGLSVRFCFKGSERERERVRVMLRAVPGVESVEHLSGGAG